MTTNDVADDTPIAAPRRGSTAKHVTIVLVLAMALIAVLAFGFGHDPNAITSPLLGHRAPGVTLRTLDNRPFSLARFHGKPIVLNFWAS